MSARSPAAWPVRVAALLATLTAAACSETPIGNNTFVLPQDGQQLPSDVGPGGGDTGGGQTDQDTVGGTTDEDGTVVGGEDTTAGTDGTVATPDSGGGKDTVTGGPVAKFAGYASAELRLRIVGPNGRGHAVVSGAVVEVAGVLFGQADEITWSTETGGTGSAHGAPFFQTDPIQLVPGDNLITVTAKNKVETATDVIKVTYNPTFSFPDRLRAAPRLVKKGVKTAVHATVALGKASNIVKGSVKLFRVDANGNTLTSFGQMLDDGNLSANGDEIKDDGLYSKKIDINDAAPGKALLRASVQVQTAGQTYTAFTDVTDVEVVENLTSADCEAVMVALNGARDAATGAGGGAAGQQAAIDSLKADPAVEEAGPAAGSGNGAWVRFKSGLLGAVNLNPAGTRGGGGAAGEADPPVAAEADLALATVQVQSKRALMLDPFAASLGANEVSAAATQMNQTACPAYTVDSLKDGNADLHAFRHMYEYGVVAVASHGDAYFGGMSADAKQGYDWQHHGAQEVVWTGHKVSCGYFGSSGPAAKACSATKACPAETECFLNQTGGNGVCVDHLTADLRRGRVVLGSDGVYGITPTFVRRHAEQSWPRSLVYLGACRTLWNGSLAGELFAAGAAAISGYNGYVANDFATKWGTTFFGNLIGQKQLSGVAYVQIEDQGHPGTFFSLVGAQNLDAAYADIINPSWETGNLQGWIKSGDGRVIAKLGASVPVAGKFMGIISTGLGYTAQVGEIKQKFCIPAGKSKFSFWWRYYSEEFKEFCGDKYQDAFLCKFEGQVGNKTVVDAKVDNLCAKGENGCTSCGSQYKGLTPADVSFDVGGVFMTPWVQTSAEITPFAGNGNVTLRLFTTDAGDAIYDTVILLDKLEFE